MSRAQQSPPPGMTQGRVMDFPGCRYPSFGIDGRIPVASLASGAPNEFIHEHLPNKQTRKLQGIVLVQVMIDTLGRGCCNRIQNFTKASEEDIRALALDQVVAKGMWQYVRPKSPYIQPVASSITLKLVFAGPGGYTADYLRMGKFKLATPKP